MTSFADLGLNPFFIERLGERHIQTPTEIQALVMPRLMQGENILFRSATGTGKTFAYLIPLIQALDQIPPGPSSFPLILICGPTYELCSQIKREADFLLAGTPYKAGLIIGSANTGRQIDGLKKDRPAIIVGNPGRLLQLARMGKLRFRSLRSLVFDEGDRLVADELLDETRELTEMIGRDLPQDGERKLLCAACSATMSAKSRERLLPLMGGQAGIVEAEGQEILRDYIEHWAIFSEGRRQIGTLRSFLTVTEAKKALVFTSRGGQVGNILTQLQHHRIAAAGLFGDMDKRLRKQALDDFRSGRVRVLVTSDLAARGLDIPGISHVIGLGISADGEVYIHRAGRTGRAGRRGIMVTIGDEEEMRRLATLEKKLGIVVYPKVLYQGRLCAPPQEPQD